MKHIKLNENKSKHTIHDPSQVDGPATGFVVIRKEKLLCVSQPRFVFLSVEMTVEAMEVATNDKDKEKEKEGETEKKDPDTLSLEGKIGEKRTRSGSDFLSLFCFWFYGVIFVCFVLLDLCFVFGFCLVSLVVFDLFSFNLMCFMCSVGFWFCFWFYGVIFVCFVLLDLCFVFGFMEVLGSI